MGRLIRAHDWTRTPLGPPAGWSATLKAMVRMALTTRHPIYIFWGPQLVGLYNDAYSASLRADKHPAILGMAGREAWSEIWHIIGPQIDMVLRGDGATWNENQLVPILRNGRLEDVYWTYSFGPIDDANAANGVGGVLVICTETTEQVQAERRLALEHERFQALFEQAPTFMAMLRGPQHVFEMVNPGYMRIIGNRPVLGRPAAQALPEAVEQGYIGVLDTVYSTGEPYTAQNARVAFPSAQGGPPEERYLDFVYQPVRDATGAVTGIFVEGADVTERRAAEQRLREAEERLRLAMEASQLGTFDMDLSGSDDSPIDVSPRTRKLFDLDPDAPVLLADCLARIPPEDVAAVHEALEQARHGPTGSSYRMRHRVCHRDGSVHWIATAGRSMQGHNVDGAHLVGVLWDVTEQQALMTELRESDRRKDEFLAMLAHELRNPLAPIRTAAHLLTRPGLTPDRLARCSTLIQRQTQTMALLLDDLLEVSRITSGKLELRRSRVPVRTVVEAAIEAARPVIDGKQHALRVMLPPDALWLDADPTRVSQVLINLLTNAAKYTDPHGRIELVVSRHGDEVRFEIRDNGIGIAPEMQAQLFRMFYQVRGSLDRAQGGLGIGLALSKGLAELHGGRLEASSKGLGQGSTFRMTLPIAAPPAEEALAASAQAPVAGTGSLAVLVADDNVDAASTMAFLLESEGYRVTLAHDGLAALDVGLNQRPRAALLDIGMPGLDGHDVARRLRATEWGRDMLLVAMTGWGQQHDKQRAQDSGFDLHFTKPVSPDDVLAALSRHLGPNG